MSAKALFPNKSHLQVPGGHIFLGIAFTAVQAVQEA